MINPRDIGSDLTPQTILVVDDEPQVRELLAEALVDMGHQVVAAKDAEDAIDKFHMQHFGIMITDMDMPRMDGLELIRHLLAERNNIDIIAITGHTLKYRYTDVIAAGASDFITKPFTLDELEAKLNRLIRERNQRLQLERLAIRDPLTGLFNRRWFEQMLRKEAVRTVRYLHPLFLFFIDIDRFKEYNDKKGHQAGDLLLIRFAEILEASIRRHVDTAFRYGGDEFTVLLPYLQIDQCFTVAERIRHNYSQLQFTPTLLSIGIARFQPITGDMDQDIENMIRRADSALYHVKRHLGGDKVYIDEKSM
jgi:diguanylate cyclase (GGDEF)-like protein